MTARGTYHHGDLRSALVQAALDLIAEKGIAALSVADAARRAGVSTAAPYRHFSNREALLVAAAIQAARLMAADLRAAVAAAPDDPCEALAATAMAYVRFVAKRRAGFDLIFAAELQHRGDTELSDAGREVMDILLPLAMAIAADAPAALALLEHHIAAAHGYAALHISGFLRRSGDIDVLAAKAAQITRTLAAAASRVSTNEVA